jgi:hypothetical protein
VAPLFGLFGTAKEKYFYIFTSYIMQVGRYRDNELAVSFFIEERSYLKMVHLNTFT